MNGCHEAWICGSGDNAHYSLDGRYWKLSSGAYVPVDIYVLGRFGRSNDDSTSFFFLF